jgi:hypothetical protein
VVFTNPTTPTATAVTTGTTATNTSGVGVTIAPTTATTTTGVATTPTTAVVTPTGVTTVPTTGVIMTNPGLIIDPAAVIGAIDHRVIAANHGGARGVGATVGIARCLRVLPGPSRSRSGQGV